LLAASRTRYWGVGRPPRARESGAILGARRIGGGSNRSTALCFATSDQRWPGALFQRGHGVQPLPRDRRSGGCAARSARGQTVRGAGVMRCGARRPRQCPSPAVVTVKPTPQRSAISDRSTAVPVGGYEVRGAAGGDEQGRMGNVPQQFSCLGRGRRRVAWVVCSSCGAPHADPPRNARYAPLHSIRCRRPRAWLRSAQTMTSVCAPRLNVTPRAIMRPVEVG
jgi:hypothetical protein